MKIIYLLFAFLFSINSYSQQKKDNTITVKGVGFMQVCNALLDAGYTVEKKDNELQTAKTGFKDGTGKAKLCKLRLLVRVKDSTAIITGHYYNVLLNNLEHIEYTKDSRPCFDDMNNFALSFSNPVIYSKQ